MSQSLQERSICGIFIDEPQNLVHLSLQDSNRSRVEETQAFEPFIWGSDSIETQGVKDLKKLSGNAQLSHQYTLESAQALSAFNQGAAKALDDTLCLKPLESQYLLSKSTRCYKGMRFSDLKRCQVDIETASSIPNSFCNPKRKGDRVLAIGMSMGDQKAIIALKDDTDEAEQALLLEFEAKLADWDPDTIEGHNFFRFDLNYLKIRCSRYKLKCNWGRFGQEATFRNSRYKVAERWVDFPRCDIPGRTVVDTYLLVQQYDVTAREMESYSLKAVARYFGITPKDGEGRTYLAGHEIQDCFWTDRKSFDSYLLDDLRETAGVAEILLPTYFAQTQNFPMTLQEILLRGTGTKVELRFLEEYHKAGQSIPRPQPVGQFAGGFSKSFEIGVFDQVMHFDVASLYPSLMLNLGKNPSVDSLGVMISMLQQLREYRLEYKKKAQEESDPALKREYDARQSSFKILINSFYGYLGFPGGRFADGELAAEITAKGRQLLQDLIASFEKLGCQVLEADTDGIYVSAPKYEGRALELLKEAADGVMPEGVELEYGGCYPKMLCYKAKNYALLKEDGQVVIRGSALRSRGMEPILKELTLHLIDHLLGVNPEPVQAHIERLTAEIESGKIDIERLAKSERLSQSPLVYEKAVAEGKKPRRAALEVALQIDAQRIKMGDKVQYYITQGEKKRMPDWQLARPVDRYDPVDTPYSPDYYLKKLKDWQKRYADFL